MCLKALQSGVDLMHVSDAQSDPVRNLYTGTIHLHHIHDDTEVLI